MCWFSLQRQSCCVTNTRSGLARTQDPDQLTRRAIFSSSAWSKAACRMRLAQGGRIFLSSRHWVVLGGPLELISWGRHFTATGGEEKTRKTREIQSLSLQQGRFWHLTAQLPLEKPFTLLCLLSLARTPSRVAPSIGVVLCPHLCRLRAAPCTANDGRMDAMSRSTIAELISSFHKGSRNIWLWVKNRYPKCNPGH